jgi:hypothetical protein
MPSAPRIITARKLGLSFQNLFGQLGPENNVTGHYSAGPRARTWKEGCDRARSFHEQHRNQGWGGIGYHFVICDDGTLICARPTILKGAHVGGHNTQNLGVNCPGTTGDKPTREQRDTYRWLLANAHTAALPAAHRTDVELSGARLWVHNMWQGHESNGCAGLFKGMYVSGLKRGDGDDEGEDFPTPPDAYADPRRIGEVVADHRHVSPEEVEQAAEDGKRGGEAFELEPDPDFDEDGALQGADPDQA